MSAQISNEQGRINDLISYNILDTAAEEDFDRLTRLASYICGTPIALITLIDSDRQWFKSAVGIDIKQTGLEVSMCKFVVKDGKTLIVHDASKDSRFADLPAVKDEPHVRFYAGVPLVSLRGNILGSFCVVDYKPRELDANQLEALDTIAEQIMLQLEMRRKQNALLSSLEDQHDISPQLGRVLDSALDMICTIGGDGRFKQLNAGALNVLGYAPEELVGKPFIDFVFAEDRERTNKMAADIMAGSFTRDFENRYIKKNGELVHIMWSAIWSEEARLFFCVARDITENKLFEQFRNNQAEILQDMAIGSNTQDIYEKIVHMLDQQIPGCICTIMLLHKDNKHLLLTACSELSAEFKAAVHGLEIGPSAGACGSAIFLGHNVFIEDMPTDPRCTQYKSLAARSGLQACWSIPFYSNHNKPLGVFSLYLPKAKNPTTAELGLITACSHLAGIAATRDATQQQLDLLETCISRLNDIVLISEAEPFDEPGPVIVFVNDAFERRTGYTRAEAIGNNPRMLQGAKTQRAELDKIRRALEQWQPVRAELINYSKNGEEFWLELDIVPVADSKGWFTHWIAVERDITERKLAELESFRINRALRMLSACHECLVRATNEKQLTQEICKIIVEIGAYQTAWIGYVQDNAEKSILPVASHGDIRHVLAQPLSWSEDTPNGQGPGGMAIRSGKPVVCPDISSDERFLPWRDKALELGYRSLITLPLMFEEAPFGILGLYSEEVLNITADELNLLQEMLSNLTFGIMNLRAREEKERIQAGVMKLAAGVSASTDSTFFQQLALNMTEALGADAGFVARLLPGAPLSASTIAGVCDGKVTDNFEYLVEHTPCQELIKQEACVVSSGVAKRHPNSQPLVSLGAEAYVGLNLTNSEGEKIGFIYVIYRKPLERSEFVLSTLRIIAARAAAEMERQVAYSRISHQASLLDKAQDAIIVRDMDGKILYWNKSAERMYGWTTEEALQGDVGESIHEDISLFKEAMQIVQAIGEWRCELPQRRKDGGKFIVDVHFSLVRDEKGEPQSILAIKTDITQRKAAENEIKYLAYYDDLTGLPNRRLLLDRLKQQLVANKRNLQQGALFLIDLDNFKTLNDTLGHDIGDLLLKKVADALTNCVREGDTVARLGGDEFVVMLGNLSIDSQMAIKQASLVAHKILDMFSHAFELAGYKHHSTPSIGITLFDGSGEYVEAILKKADLAMYQAKASGRNMMRFFDPDMQSVVTNRVELEDDLRQALDKQEFLLLYQPQVSIEYGVIGAEALIRWNHSRRGLVSPIEFIPIAEETGLILPIGQWVLKTACQQLVEWASSEELKHLSIAVNVSARQLRHADFVKNLLSILEETGANPNKLKLELTESVLVDNIEDTIKKMTSLKSNGIKFSLDDFGTGYSSLVYLKRLPLEQLKIDQSFVRDILTNQNDATIANTIITLAQSMGLDVLAEGVETIEQRNFLAGRGCMQYQGYYFSKPISAAAFKLYVADSSVLST
jgi:diguanylate cyclase (GGDEF)-like protein/PAS domain S-box-containing protein